MQDAEKIQVRYHENNFSVYAAQRRLRSTALQISKMVASVVRTPYF
jgi:hypothetical protein